MCVCVCCALNAAASSALLCSVASDFVCACVRAFVYIYMTVVGLVFLLIFFSFSGLLASVRLAFRSAAHSIYGETRR